MKYPLIYRILAIFQLVISLIALFISLAVLNKLLRHPEGILFPAAGFVVFLLTFGIWFLICSIAWFLKSRYSYVFLITSILSIIITLSSVLMLVAGSDEKAFSRIALPSVLIFSVYIIFISAAALFPSIKNWSQQHGTALKMMLNPAILTFFLIFSFGGFLTLCIINFIGKWESCTVYAVSSSGDSVGHKAGNAVDDDINTWWTPGFRSGRGEWLQVEFKPQVISAVDILGGAHSNNKKENAYPQYNRLKEGELEFSNGDKMPIILEDKDGIQRIKFDDVKASWIKLHIKKVIQGIKYDELAVSYFHIMRHIPVFKESRTQ